MSVLQLLTFKNISSTHPGKVRMSECDCVCGGMYIYTYYVWDMCAKEIQMYSPAVRLCVDLKYLCLSFLLEKIVEKIVYLHLFKSNFELI